MREGQERGAVKKIWVREEDVTGRVENWLFDAQNFCTVGRT